MISNGEIVAVAVAAATCAVAATSFVLRKRNLEAVETPTAPAAIGPYAQAIKDGRGTLYVSGQVGFVPGTKEFAGDDVESQTRRALLNLRAILHKAGSGMKQVLKTTVLLKDMKDFGTVNQVYAELFGDHKPARACFEVAKLPAGALVEVEAIACYSDNF